MGLQQKEKCVPSLDHTFTIEKSWFLWHVQVLSKAALFQSGRGNRFLSQRMSLTTFLSSVYYCVYACVLINWQDQNALAHLGLLYETVFIYWLTLGGGLRGYQWQNKIHLLVVKCNINFESNLWICLTQILSGGTWISWLIFALTWETIF